MVRVDERTGQRLVSYAVTDDETADLHRHLSERLPRYMVPSAVLRLPALPLTENGKVDLTALPAPAARSFEYVAPRDELEAELAALWAECLGIERVGARDNFFDSGGHSLMLAQLAGRVTEVFGVQLPLQELFEAETLDEMANLILAAQLAALDGDEAAAMLAEVRHEAPE